MDVDPHADLAALCPRVRETKPKPLAIEVRKLNMLKKGECFILPEAVTKDEFNRPAFMLIDDEVLTGWVCQEIGRYGRQQFSPNTDVLRIRVIHLVYDYKDPTEPPTVGKITPPSLPLPTPE